MKNLFSTTRIPVCSGFKQSPLLRHFKQGEDGNVTVLSLALIAILGILASVAWDMNGNEFHRVRMQNTADRAVLAAADLDQTLSPDEVVRDYFDKAGYPTLVTGVNISEGLNFRTVSVSSAGIMETDFIKGQGGEREMLVNVFSEAEERVNNVEISMVLDISGSMSEGSKMSNLRDAASTFVDTVITEETKDLVSLSVVPYSEHVSAGPEIMSKFNVDWDHSYSHCMEFSEADFDRSDLRRDKTYDQVQHFQWGYNGYNNDRSTPVCPIGADEDVVAFSQNASDLKYKIGRLVPRGSTSIFAGMKWATGLLDPDFRTINQQLIQDGDADPAFSARPAAFDDHETLKTVILMTDGQNHYSYRIDDRYYANSSHVAHWNRYNLNWYLSRYVSSRYHDNFKYVKYWPDYGDTLLDKVCDAAKEKNIVIWSIGFEVSDHGADVMRNCASSPSHFFRVEGVEIKEAFKAIARQINQLRLTQ
ncbi:TadE/TadG family type IV pilus assembly protein [Sulfitobacter donghicola]|uniref:VWFA domain-containing protein n=1 Tax=Sulfitobacter donghicola DSW-25 = KCTC 12864 = JCM 14565 TaxID=1300350 RepID=A0A073II77_9RHOB|nr:TadE/TadG family type IV pilus assembly protein [Sulfitobacter donghicola]KEJ89275.1 hypothetical protein DSW25_09620 [Sulfitobacter donghicola DSW-25 = KCTC 12864 = JCM 14565]